LDRQKCGGAKLDNGILNLPFLILESPKAMQRSTYNKKTVL
jgi:hypothetical protein